MEKCRRCGRDYEDPYPEIVSSVPHANMEIMSIEWCAGCNAMCAMLIHRDSSAYYTLKIKDPLRGGGHEIKLDG